MRKEAALVLLAAFIFVTLPSFGAPARQICEVTSPVDGSVWTGTDGDGLVRTGRNGKVLHYGLSSGQLGSDTIYSLFFDSDQVLWILDASMRLSSYTSTQGFIAVRDSVTFLSAVSSTGSVYYSVGDTLFSAKNGIIAKILFSPDFDFPVPQPAQPEKSNSHGLVFLVAILAFLAGCAVSYIIYKVRSSREEPAVSPAVAEPLSEINVPVEPVVQTEVPSAPEEPAQEETTKEPGEFTKVVLDLVKEHLSDPDFGVESIAEITGMSRIHVNRKLKSEGAPAPSAMVKKERMDKAEQLLRSGEYSIADISRLCGFRTPAYFATAFKDYFGCTPTDFLSK